jgi:hypothetical protein
MRKPKKKGLVSRLLARIQIFRMLLFRSSQNQANKLVMTFFFNVLLCFLIVKVSYGTDPSPYVIVETFCPDNVSAVCSDKVRNFGTGTMVFSSYSEFQSDMDHILAFANGGVGGGLEPAFSIETLAYSLPPFSSDTSGHVSIQWPYRVTSSIYSTARVTMRYNFQITGDGVVAIVLNGGTVDVVKRLAFSGKCWHELSAYSGWFDCPYTYEGTRTVTFTVPTNDWFHIEVGGSSYAHSGVGGEEVHSLAALDSKSALDPYLYISPDDPHASDLVIETIKALDDFTPVTPIKGLALLPIDFDEDGYLSDVDCADYNASIHPGAIEVCDDGVDNDCDRYADLQDVDCGACVDVDQDHVCDDLDNCNGVPNTEQADKDSDGIGDVCDNCPNDSNSNQLDTDGDGIGDACETDYDNDGVLNESDNCIYNKNPNQSDQDGDGIGDACDSDIDGDGVANDVDNCVNIANPGQEDLDRDGIGDECDLDIDGDGRSGEGDNCPTISNPDQSDMDDDGLGDACDSDIDNDGVLNESDNCPLVANPDQTDTNGDGIGDACYSDYDTDGDGYISVLMGGSDCDDLDPSVNPGMPEIPYNGKNDDCNLATRDDDLDGDGYLRSEWITGSVDSTGDVGLDSSIAVDSNNKVHISYLDNWPNMVLKYATNASGSWVITTVDSNGSVGYFTSIAVDSKDKVHISYYDGSNRDLKYATNASGSWVITRVDSDGFVGYYTSIAVDSKDNVHISYLAFDQDYNGSLKYATNASGSWVATTVDSSGDAGYYTSIAVDSNDNVHIGYFDRSNWDLKYANNVTGSWVTSTVDSTGDVGAETSIAVDSNNKVHISYVAFDLDDNGSLKYATNESGSWVATTVDSSGDAGYYTSIAVDSGNNIYISYYDSTNADLNYAMKAQKSIDCDDSNASINPWANDNSCDGVDDNCNGTPDDGYVQIPTTCGVGACASTGWTTCSAGVEGNTCTPGTPTAEICDSIDNDCNGLVDDNLTRPTTCGVGACASIGTETCTAGTWGNDTCASGSPTAETCNNIDDDCDGTTDEGLTRSTTCGIGACSGNTGIETCSAGTWGNDTCDPLAGASANDATCNGIDDDCNGITDEDYVATNTTCGQGVCASTGQLICVNGATQDTCTAGPQTGNDDNCNGVDENCNGTADENYVAVPTTCGIGACRSTGQLICSGGTELNTCTPGSPQPELCDGIDNNCNGVVDEDLIQQCGVSNIGACRYGEQTCINGSWGACVGNIDPTPEICDGIDNDCDGVVPSDEADTDGDSTLDCKDGCPNDPAKVEPGICGCGVADTDTDNDGILDCNDDCPDVSGPADQNGCPYADITRVTMRIIDLQRSGVCQWPNGQPKLTCEMNLKDVQVKVFDREDPDFNSAYGRWPSRHLLDDIYEANIGILGVCSTNENGECTIGEDHPGKFLVIAKYQESGVTVYTGKFKNFKWNRSGCLWHWENDDDDVDGSTPPEKITKHLHILKQIRRNGEITFLGGFREVVSGSQLDIDHPEYKVWQDEQELYPFVFTSGEDWDIDVCMSVPGGYRLVGIQDENEQVVSTSSCVHTFVAGESKVFLFDVEDVGSPEPDMSFSLTTKHEGKVAKVLKKITGMRKWNEEKIEKRVHTKIKKLAPKWQKRAKALLERIGKR